jgi:hypothetical protein
MDNQIQVVTVPVTDVDQAAAFYTHQARFALDVDYHRFRTRRSGFGVRVRGSVWEGARIRCHSGHSARYRVTLDPLWGVFLHSMTGSAAAALPRRGWCDG